MLRVRIDEGSEEQPQLLWDSLWNPWEGRADWALADASEKLNRGGLAARQALHTAVVIALFTDRRVPDEHPLRYLVDGSDPRGWFGDGVDVRNDLAETEMGSLLWIFERSVLTESIRRWVEAIALEALAPLVAQKIAVRIEAQATMYAAVNRCDLAVQIYGRNGKQVYEQRFEDLWKQTATAPKPPRFSVSP